MELEAGEISVTSLASSATITFRPFQVFKMDVAEAWILPVLCFKTSGEKTDNTSRLIRLCLSPLSMRRAFSPTAMEILFGKVEVKRGSSLVRMNLFMSGSVEASKGVPKRWVRNKSPYLQINNGGKSEPDTAWISAKKEKQNKTWHKTRGNLKFLFTGKDEDWKLKIHEDPMCMRILETQVLFHKD